MLLKGGEPGLELCERHIRSAGNDPAASSAEASSVRRRGRGFLPCLLTLRGCVLCVCVRLRACVRMCRNHASLLRRDTLAVNHIISSPGGVVRDGTIATASVSVGLHAPVTFLLQ